MEIKELNSKSIVQYLEQCGYKRTSGHGKWVMFSSPLRTDKNASFGVNTVTNTWSDFGSQNVLGVGSGSIIDLVMKIENIGFTKACEFLEKGNLSNITKKDNVVGINVTETTFTLSDRPELLNYICGIRRIRRDVVDRFCKIVSFDFGFSEYRLPLFGVGFKNDLGGWEIRNEYYKVASQPKTITTIGEGEHVYIFEGFINFLSFMSELDIKKEPHCIVLNGAGQVGRVNLEGKAIDYFGDNDATGNKVLKELQSKYEVRDRRYLYEWYDDYNEYLMSK